MPREYVVFRYQYNDMPKPKWNAHPTHGDRGKTLDCLPPTITHHFWVNASTKPEAIRIGKEFFNK